MGRHSERMEQHRNELLSDLASVVKEVGVEFCNIDADRAEQMGYSVADYMAGRWGGQNFTFPKDSHFKQHKRDWEMYNDFRGNNYTELAFKYGVTERWVRKVVARIGKIDMADRQQDIFSRNSAE